MVQKKRSNCIPKVSILIKVYLEVIDKGIRGFSK